MAFDSGGCSDPAAGGKIDMNKRRSSEASGETLFSLLNPDRHETPVVVSIPHSGRFIPADIRRQFLPDVVLPNMDWFLPELYAFLADMGVTTLMNRVSRYVIDPNRAETQTDGNRYSDSLVYRQTTQGRPFYAVPPSKREIRRRTELYYHPYHAALQKLLRDKAERFGRVYLFDLHSFAADVGAGANLILGNAHGASCSPEFFQWLSDQFSEQGFCVRHNEPFAGGYITRRYGVCGSAVEAVQIELRYCAYIENRYFGEEELSSWDEALFCSAQKKLADVFAAITSLQSAGATVS